MQHKYLFESYNYCEICHRNLSPDYTGTVCPSCQEHNLFQQVKDFIRSGDFNEYQVAEHFKLPVQQIRKWIREGRIQYKENENKKVTMHCYVCGAPVAFGSICPKCLKAQNTSSGVTQSRSTDPGNMRHLKITKNE